MRLPKRYSRIGFITALGAVLFSATSALSQGVTDKEGLAAFREEILSLCQNPNAAGSYLKVEGDGSGEVSVGLPRLVGKAGIEGKAKFSKEEWAGVRKVLDQNTENKDFRKCVLELTPKLIDKFVRTSRSTNELLQKLTLSTPLQAVEQVLGPPISEREVERARLPKEHGRSRTVLKQFDTKELEFYLVTSGKVPHTAFALRLKQNTPAKIPIIRLYENRKYLDDIGSMTFGLIAERCKDDQPINTVGPLLIAPVCTFAPDEGGGTANFSFGYDWTSAADDFEKCKRGKKTADQLLSCKSLMSMKPAFFFAHNDWNPEGNALERRNDLMFLVLAVSYNLRGNW